MAEAELEGTIRTERSKASRRELRKSGMIPAVIYGKNVGSEAIAIELKALRKTLAKWGQNALINMKIKENGETKTYKALVKELQYDPVRRDLIHVDFHQISLKDKVHATVPIHLVGTSPGVAAGGILTTPMRQIEVECLATEIPELIEIDISELEIGDIMTIGELSTAPEVKILAEPDVAVVAVTVADRPEEEEEEEDHVAEEEMDEEGTATESEPEND
ncbi:MAG: 50S ribosomal protein L25/general stress protein Ctc [Peptococcaceae bacterium]|nr:50S ribosomal protein L25/general stress protein Ctc [Peptococcaceae bacterium]